MILYKDEESQKKIDFLSIDTDKSIAEKGFFMNMNEHATEIMRKYDYIYSIYTSDILDVKRNRRLEDPAVRELISNIAYEYIEFMTADLTQQRQYAEMLEKKKKREKEAKKRK